MRKYRILSHSQEGDLVEILTEKEILDQYFDYWKSRMAEVGNLHQLKPIYTVNEIRQLCIQDFITIHWGEEIK